MRMRKRILVYSGLACTVLVLVPTTAAAAKTSALAVGSGAAAPPGYITASTSGIHLPNNSHEYGQAKCPKGTVVLSGGAYIASSSLMTGINTSLPISNRVWEVATNNLSGSATTFNVYAVCAKRPKGYKQLFGHEVSNPAGDRDRATVHCPASDVVFGGGVQDGASVSIDMASSYPGTSTSWTAAVSNFSTTRDNLFAVAVCGAAFPHYAIRSKSASDPADAQKGIIEHCAAKAVVIGGGNKSSNTTRLRIEMKTTQPFPASGSGWKSGENNDTASNTTLTAYAICAT